jgi:hypothetical protein
VETKPKRTQTIHKYLNEHEEAEEASKLRKTLHQSNPHRKATLTQQQQVTSKQKVKQ